MAGVATKRLADIAEAEGLEEALERLCGQDDHERATPLAERALSLREGALGPEHPDLIGPLSKLASLYEKQKAYEKAEVLFLRALAIGEKAFGSSHPALIEVLCDLASVKNLVRAYEAATPLLLRALAISEEAYGSEHERTLRLLAEVGVQYFILNVHGGTPGAYEKAIEFIERVTDIAERGAYLAGREGEEMLDLVRRCHPTLAELHQHQGEHARVESALLRALAFAEKRFGPSDLEVAYALDELSRHYESLGRYDRGEPMVVRALVIAEATLGACDPGVARLREKLAAFHEEMSGLRAQIKPS